MTGHVVILPRANPHRIPRLVTDLDLVLAATIASVRRNQRQILFEPPPSLAQCARCREAYTQARKVIKGRGRVAGADGEDDGGNDVTRGRGGGAVAAGAR